MKMAKYVIVFMLVLAFLVPVSLLMADNPNKPPKVKVEIKTEQPGTNYFWVGGHWAWKKGKWVWIKGHWKKTITGKSYVNGYWKKTAKGQLWVDGYWRAKVKQAKKKANRKRRINRAKRKARRR